MFSTFGLAIGLGEVILPANATAAENYFKFSNGNQAIISTTNGKKLSYKVELLIPGSDQSTPVVSTPPKKGKFRPEKQKKEVSGDRKTIVSGNNLDAFLFHSYVKEKGPLPTGVEAIK